MANDNAVTIIGNCTRDPELRYTNGGMQVAGFGVAINQRRRNNDTGQWEDGETSYFDVTCFRELAENVALQGRDHRRRGRPVASVGHRLH